jgi:hypothetical protein
VEALTSRPSLVVEFNKQVKKLVDYMSPGKCHLHLVDIIIHLELLIVQVAVVYFIEEIQVNNLQLFMNLSTNRMQLI